nr:PspC domain-containing protein [Sporosarcina limicola]
MNRLTKSSTDKVLLGVCAGIAEFFAVSPLIVRLLFVILPVSLVFYLILAVLLPEGFKDFRK